MIVFLYCFMGTEAVIRGWLTLFFILILLCPSACPVTCDWVQSIEEFTFASGTFFRLLILPWNIVHCFRCFGWCHLKLCDSDLGDQTMIHLTHLATWDNFILLLLFMILLNIILYQSYVFKFYQSLIILFLVSINCMNFVSMSYLS